MGGKRHAEIKIKGTTFDEEGWRSRGNCRGMDPDLMFPLSDKDVDKGKAVCVGCPVSQECLEFALTNGEKHGIWGGYSEKEIDRIRRIRRKAG